MRTPLTAVAAVSCALVLSACGSEGVSVDPASNASAGEGAEIFATHCAGCHTIGAAGSQGSGNRGLRAQGPNFDQRVESYDEVLFAIRNGGFSGAIMPQNIVVGDEAAKVAEFVSKYSGSDVDESPRPTSSGSEVETGESSASPSDVPSEAPPGSAGGQSGDAAAGGGESDGGQGGGQPSGGQAQSSDAG